jgi:hypothetical protein
MTGMKIGKKMETQIKIGDLVREDVFHNAYPKINEKVWRYGIVVDKLVIKGIVHDMMYKVCWSACPRFPVSTKPYTCFVSEKQLEVVS